MTDQDARLIRTLISKYGFDHVILELLQVASAWSAYGERWDHIKKLLKGVHILTVGKERNDECDIDPNESGRPLRTRKDLSAQSAGVQVLRSVPQLRAVSSAGRRG